VGVGIERLPVPEVRGDPDGVAHRGDPQLEATHVGAPSLERVEVMCTHVIDPPIQVAAYCLDEA